MADEAMLSALNPGTIIINSSRGEIANTGALKKVKSAGKVESLVLDVWENEPEIDRELLAMTSVATPHIAGYSADGKANGTAMIVRNLSKSFGLPLADWYPAEVPATPEPVLTIDCRGKSNEEILRKAILHTYNIVEDDIRLRFDPSRFEKERENYPVRREFSFYTINLTDGNEEIKNLLENLGFKVQNKQS